MVKCCSITYTFSIEHMLFTINKLTIKFLNFLNLISWFFQLFETQLFTQFVEILNSPKTCLVNDLCIKYRHTWKWSLLNWDFCIMGNSMKSLKNIQHFIQNCPKQSLINCSMSQTKVSLIVLLMRCSVQLVPFVQFKKREKHPWRMLLVVKLQVLLLF